MPGAWKPHYVGCRPAVFNALSALPDTHLVADPADADLLVVDLHTPYQDELRSQLGKLRRAPATTRVVLSVLGADEPGTNGYAAEIAELEHRVRSDTRCCVLRCAMLGQALPRHLEWVVKLGNLHGCFAERGVAWLHATDVAELVEVLYRTPEKCAGAYDVTGPELLSMADLADAIGKAMALPVGYVPLEQDEYRQAMAEAGLEEQVARRLTEWQVLASTGKATGCTDIVRGALGHATPLHSYLDRVVAEAGFGAAVGT